MKFNIKEFIFGKPKSLHDTSINIEEVVIEKEKPTSKKELFDQAVAEVFYKNVRYDTERAIILFAYGEEVVKQTTSAQIENPKGTYDPDVWEKTREKYPKSHTNVRGSTGHFGFNDNDTYIELIKKIASTIEMPK